MILLGRKRSNRISDFKKKRVNHDSFQIFEEKFDLDVIRFFKNSHAEISYTEERIAVDDLSRCLYITYSKLADLYWAYAQLKRFEGDISLFTKPMIREYVTWLN